MKRFASKITALLLAIVLVCATVTLCSCSNTGKAMLKLGKTEITENMYIFWLSRYKATFESQYGASVKTAYNVSSVDQFWPLTFKDDDGSTKTYDDMFSEYIYENARTYLMALYLFDEFGLSLSDTDKKDIDEYVDSLIEDFANGSKNEFNVVLAEYGLNLATLKVCYETDAKITVLQNYLFGKNGPEQITDADIEAYYQENYVRMEQICIFLDQCPEKGEDGKYLTDKEGNIAYRDMSVAETTLARQRGDEALSKLNLGSDFAAVKAEYNENAESDSYTDGIYLSKDNAYNGGEDTTKLYDTLKEMKDGEFRLIELEHTLHIIRKLPLEAGAYKKSVNTDFFTYYDASSAQYVTFEKYVQTPIFLSYIEKKLKEYDSQITVDEDIKNNTKISKVKSNYYF